MSAEDGRTKAILFREGYIAEIDTGREDTLLEAALLKTGAFSDRDLKRARKVKVKEEKTLGAALLDLEIAPEDRLQDNLRGEMANEVCDILGWSFSSVGFFEHDADKRLENFCSELGQYYDVYTDPEEVFLEGARRLEDWALVEGHFGLLRDVFYATPASMKYIQEQASHPYEHAIISAVDGTKDVAEVIETISAQHGLDRFVAVNTVRSLMQTGELELINPVQMYQLGVEQADKNQLEKACRLFRRANEHGLDDFDLQLKLAQLLETRGEHAESCDRYMQFSTKCLEQGRLEEALRALRRVLRMDPGQLIASGSCIDILLKQNRNDDAREEAIQLAGKLAAGKDPRAGLNLLYRVREASPNDLKLQQKIADIAATAGDEALLREERALLAQKLELCKDVEAALESYQRIFCDGQDTLEVRLKLVELHKQRGNRQKALDHINAILNFSDKKRVLDERVNVKLHETVRELKPADLRSNRWMADYWLRVGDKEKAIEILTAWVTQLQVAQDDAEVVHAFEKLISIDNRYEHRWGLVAVLEKIGRLKDSHRELRSLANLALRRKDFEEAGKALDAALKTAPLDLETRKLQVELLEATGARELYAKACRELVVVSALSGNVQEGAQYCRRLPQSSSADAEAIHRIGVLGAEQGERNLAVEQCLVAARIYLQNQDYGSSRRALANILALEPAHPEALALEADLVRRAAQGPAAESQALETSLTALQANLTVPQAGLTVPQASLAMLPAAPAAPQAAPAVPPAAVVAPIEPTASRPTAGEAGRPQAQPFQPAAPVKTSVSNITARLRNLKSCEKSDAASGVAVKQVKGISAKLRSLKQESAATGDGPAKEGSSTDPESLPPAPDGEPEKATAQSSTALTSAASRLKALAEKKAQAMGNGDSLTLTPAPAAGDAESPPAPPVAAPKSPPGSEVVSEEAASKLAATIEERADGAVAKKKLALGGSASRLAELRKKAQAEA